jgi:hypothetical protein
LPDRTITGDDDGPKERQPKNGSFLRFSARYASNGS